MMKAAEDLKQQQLLREQERQRILGERVVKLPDLENVNDQGAATNISIQTLNNTFYSRADETRQ